MRWLEQCRAWVEQYDPLTPSMITEFHHYGFVRRLSEALPDNAIIVSDTGGNVIMMGHAFRSKKGQRIFSSNGNTPMGFALCGAIGAWFAEPDRPIICIIGDGGMQLNIQELQTIVHYGAKVKVFILNNGILGNTKSYQRVNGKAEIACGPDGYSAPDFCKIAEAYAISETAISQWRVMDRADMQTALGCDGPFVVNVLDPDRCQYEPRMSRWDCPIEEMHPAIPVEEFKNNMKIEPLEGWEKRR